MLASDTKASSTAKPSLSEWEVESFRFTLFTADARAPERLENWWREVSGVPDRRVAHDEQTHAEQGIVDEEMLRLKWQPGRIDWYLSPKLPESREEASKVISLGCAEPAMRRFRKHLDSWFDEKGPPESVRVALATVVMKAVQNRKQGYEILDALLPNVTLDIENIRDFRYIINRRRPSKSVANLEVNRLANWLVAELTPIRIEIRPGKRTTARQTWQGVSQLACRVEFDINTSPEYTGKFSAEKQREVLDELASLTLELVAEGDIP